MLSYIITTYIINKIRLQLGILIFNNTFSLNILFEQHNILKLITYFLLDFNIILCIN